MYNYKMSQEEHKKIVISGTNNRYQMNKLMRAESW